MTTFKASSSRAPSRAGSTAHDIVRRRDKKYKTEQKRVLERRKKLEFQTSYANAPKGYVFLPVGTPDLSDRCKDLSRQQAYPVHVVNAKPVSKHAWDTQKVSHHIHRIGYHFRGEIVEQACEELGYVLHDEKYLKAEDFMKRSKETSLSKTLMKYGINMTLSTQTRENLDQVRAAIKELFPRIPEEDLHEIVKHAWAEGSDRVGTNSTMDLPRRVQLAVIARIRHNYTDYDRLLRAFEWGEARKIVEPECLQKIIEWRGENDNMDDDQELEEIVRETIVIDDDEDGVVDHGDVVELDDMSDTSIEITHSIALDGDLGAESMDERSRVFHNRFLPVRRTLAQRSDIARQKIGAARKRIRDGLPSRTNAYPHNIEPVSLPEYRVPTAQYQQNGIKESTQPRTQVQYSAPHRLVGPIQVIAPYQQERGQTLQREELIIGGQRYIRASDFAEQPQPEYRHLNPSHEAAPAIQQGYGRNLLPPTPQYRTGPITARRNDLPPYDHPMASIERGELGGDFASVGYHTNSPARRGAPPPGAEIIDLTSPPRQQFYAPLPQNQVPIYDRPQTYVQRVLYREQLPVHGAPAPVQYRMPGAWPDSPARVHPPPPPADGAAAPTQYYYPR